jgi:acetyltransferase
MGMAVDKQFGPFLLFGRGGTAAEVINDKALALPPLNLALAREMMGRTRIWRQLLGYRDVPPADTDAIARTLVQLSQLIADFAEIAELDINPLLASAKGVIALDARVRLVKADGGEAGKRFSIPSYPKELERIEPIAGMGEMLLRPIRPEDGPALEHMFEQLSLEDVRLRFFTPMRELPRGLLARLTQIDYDREMAFVLIDRSSGEFVGISRISTDPDNIRAEFAISVLSNLKGRGLGRLLMERVIAHARARGTQEIAGDVLNENSRMLALCRELGFSIHAHPDSHGLMQATLRLT